MVCLKFCFMDINMAAGQTSTGLKEGNLRPEVQ